MVSCSLHLSHHTFSLALPEGSGLPHAGEKGSAGSGGRSSAGEAGVWPAMAAVKDCPWGREMPPGLVQPAQTRAGQGVHQQPTLNQRRLEGPQHGSGWAQLWGWKRETPETAAPDSSLGKSLHLGLQAPCRPSLRHRSQERVFGASGVCS